MTKPSKEELEKLAPFRPYLDYADAILKALPPVESLDGYTLEFRESGFGDDVYVDDRIGRPISGRWRVNKAICRTSRVFVRTPIPIPKYIPTEYITDNLVQVLGRLECELWDSGETPTMHILTGVDIAYRDEDFNSWDLCSIKEQTVLDAFNRLSDDAKAEACERLEWLKEIVG